MEIMLDTIDIDSIVKYNECLNIAGITSNPSIIKKHGKVKFEDHMKKIRNVIGKEKSLHIQVIGLSSEQIIQDARRIITKIDKDVFVKIPTTIEGLKAMKILKENNVNVTATAVYSIFQGMMALNVGADYVAPYFNRMENMGVDARGVLSHLQNEIIRSGSNQKVLAASFKNNMQIIDVLSTGVSSMTISPEIIGENLNVPIVNQAVRDFSDDWFYLYNQKNI